MRYYHVEGDSTDRRLVAVRDGTAYDLTGAAGLGSFSDLVHVARAVDETPDAVAERRLSEADELEISDSSPELRTPVDADEVWAAGVTYEISEEARKAESTMPEIYLNVYDAERPEIFFKATPNRVVAPGETVGIRSDSEWNVPEPELGIVLYEGEIVGYTVGNDMSSRDIEGENPLYLPQAKTYARCCSIGPCVVSAESVSDPHDLEMSMEIERDGEIVYSDSTTTANMVRSCEELVSYFVRNNAVPDVAVLLTGTSLVPSEDFTLAPDDVIRIDIEEIGELANDVSYT